MTKLRILVPMWRSLVADPDALCALSLGNLGALVLLLVIQLWLGLGGR
jgi:hypothetical protein